MSAVPDLQINPLPNKDVIMPTEIVKYCLISLLSLSGEEKTAEIDQLLFESIEGSQFAICLREYSDDIIDEDESGQITVFGGGGVGQAIRKKEEKAEKKEGS